MRIVLAIMIIILALATIGVWFNSGSEKLLTTFGLGLAGIIAASISVLIFGAEQPIHKAFSSKLISDRTSNLPVFYPELGPIIMTGIFAVAELKTRPELRDPDDPEGMVLFHHLLQRIIIGWLQEQYPLSWEADVLPLNMGESYGYTFTSKPVPSKIYEPTELAQKMEGNKFSNLPGPLSSIGLAVPPGTQLKVVPPYKDQQMGYIGKIILKNWYSTITIETRFAGYRQGIGSYAMILGLSENQSNTLATNQYFIIIDASFTWYLAGNPEMPRYRKWALDISNGIEDQFDERILWPKARDSFLLRRALTSQIVQNPVVRKTGVQDPIP